MLLRIVLVSLFVAIASCQRSKSNQNESKPEAFGLGKPWVYFDLGDTVIKVEADGEDYFPGTREHLANLRKAGVGVGLIINIPESWGRAWHSKFAELVRFIDSARVAQYPDSKWKGNVPFEWNDFDDVIIPMLDIERKPKPPLFELAKQHANNCPILFEGEDADERATAKSLGLAVHEMGAAAPYWVTDVRAYLKANLEISTITKYRCSI